MLRAEDRAPKPWRNGGGLTYDVASAPPGAGFEDFDWRISFAQVASEGPFSFFPNVDRTLTLARGRGMTLVFGDGARALTSASDPLSFPGDVPVVSRLADGPILDLNVMTRRGRFAHRVRRLGAAETDLAPKAPIAFLACLEGEALLEAEGRSERLAALDLAELGARPTRIDAAPDARLVLIEIAPALDEAAPG
jgi:hypothetical protein